MFSTKIYVLSVLVFSLFNLGQAAPIIDEVSDLSTRDYADLDARGFFDFFHKEDKDTKKVTDIGACHYYNSYTQLQKSHQTYLKKVEAKLTNSTLSESSKKAYKNLEKKLKAEIKTTENKIKKQVKTLNKHGFKDVATRCAPKTSTHTNLQTQPAKSHSSDQHTLAATSHHSTDSHATSPQPNPAESQPGPAGAQAQH